MSDPHRHTSGAHRPGDILRRRHGLHFNDCEATNRYSPIYMEFFCRDLAPYLLTVLRELETRASMVLAGEPRRRVLELLYARQDNERERLTSFFIQCTDAALPWQLGFGHVGCGHMGITDASLCQQHLDEFRENIWTTVVKESRRILRRSAGH